MSNIDNILRALLIAAAVANLVSTVHNVLRLRRPDRLTAAMETWTEEDPKSNFAVYLLKEHPDGKIELKKALKKYEEWKRENEPELPIQLLNDRFVLEAIAMGRPETPPDES